MSFFDTSAIAPIDQAQLPASVRNGDQTAKNAYQAGLAFEQILVNELTTELAATSSSSDGSDGSDGSDSASGLLGTSDPASSMYSQLLPTALTSAVMGSGGTGMALQLASAIDPALTANAANAASAQVPVSGGAAVSPVSGGASVSASAPTSSAATTATGGVAPSPTSSTAPTTSASTGSADSAEGAEAEDGA